MERGVGGGTGMGNTCKPMAVSFQCMTKFPGPAPRSFILLQVVDQFSHHHLLKRLSFFLASFVEGKVSIGSWIYLWAFYSVPLICISVFVLTYCI